MHGSCIGLRYYAISESDSGYIINTNYKSMKELVKIVLGISIFI